MKILRKSILAFLAVLVLAAAAFASGGRVTLLSLNDIHGHIYPEDGEGGLAKAATVIEAVRGENPGNTFLFEIGDVNEGPLFFYFHGHAEMRGLSLLGTDGAPSATTSSTSARTCCSKRCPEPGSPLWFPT